MINHNATKHIHIFKDPINDGEYRLTNHKYYRIKEQGGILSYVGYVQEKDGKYELYTCFNSSEKGVTTKHNSLDDCVSAFAERSDNAVLSSTLKVKEMNLENSYIGKCYINIDPDHLDEVNIIFTTRNIHIALGIGSKKGISILSELPEKLTLYPEIKVESHINTQTVVKVVFSDNYVFSLYNFDNNNPKLFEASINVGGDVYKEDKYGMMFFESLKQLIEKGEQK